MPGSSRDPAPPRPGSTPQTRADLGSTRGFIPLCLPLGAQAPCEVLTTTTGSPTPRDLKAWPALPQTQPQPPRRGPMPLCGPLWRRSAGQARGLRWWRSGSAYSDAVFCTGASHFRWLAMMVRCALGGTPRFNFGVTKLDQRALSGIIRLAYLPGGSRCT